MNSKSGKVTYRVEAVISHKGNAENGHYVCNIYEKYREGEWTQFDNQNLWPDTVARKSNEGGTLFILRRMPKTTLKKLTQTEQIKQARPTNHINKVTDQNIIPNTCRGCKEKTRMQVLQGKDMKTQIYQINITRPANNSNKDTDQTITPIICR